MALGVIDGFVKSCGSAADTIECFNYDPSTNSWTEGGRLITPRESPRSSFIDGIWLISGDDTVSGDYPQSTEIWTGSAFEQGPFIPEEMHHHCQLTINSTHVFFQEDASGHGPNTYLLDWNSQTWTELPGYVGDRFYASCGLINNPENGLEVVVTSEGTSDIFNFNDMTWRPGPDFVDYVYESGYAQLRDTFVLVGGDKNGDELFWPDTIYLFDHLNYEWILMDQSLQMPRESYAGVVAVPDDFVNCS